MDKDDKARILWPNRSTAEWQLRKLSNWWDETHQLHGLPYAAFTSFISFPHATRGARTARAEGWKWWYPNCLFALARGGYGALFLYVRGTGGPGGACALKVEEEDVREQLEIAGNCVCVVATWLEAVDVLCEYANGNMVRPAEE